MLIIDFRKIYETLFNLNFEELDFQYRFFENLYTFNIDFEHIDFDN